MARRGDGEVMLPTVTEEQNAFLQKVFEFFHAGRPWPTFDQLDREFFKKDINLAAVLRTTPPAYAWYDRGHLLDPSPEMELALTVFGLGQCEGSEGDLELFFAALRWLISVEVEYSPTPDAPSANAPSATAEDLRKHLSTLGLSPSAADVRKIGMLLRHEPPSGGRSFGGPAEDWTAFLNRRIREYQGVGDLAGYLEVVRRTAPRLYGLDQPSTASALDAAETDYDSASGAVDSDLAEYLDNLLQDEDWEKLPTQTVVFLEGTVRQWAMLPIGVSGKDLWVKVLHPKSGKYPLGETDGEKQGWFQLGMGFSLAVRNAHSHRIVKRQDAKTYALGIIGTASLLLTQLKYEHASEIAEARAISEPEIDVPESETQAGEPLVRGR